MFQFHYKKSENTQLFTDFNNPNLVNMYNIQNYLPLYNKFFDINNTNFNSFNLSQKYSISSILEKKTENIYKIILTDNYNSQTLKTDTFIKFAGLYDPVKYISGKYKKYLNNSTFYNLPTLLPENTKISTNTPDFFFNSVYVDSFFSFLSSQLLNFHKFPNGLNFYGSFTGNKNNFNFNSYDDFTYIKDQSYFLNNKDKLFKFENIYPENLLNYDTRINKKPLLFNKTIDDIPITEIDIQDFDNVFIDNNNNNQTDDDIKPLTQENLIFKFSLKKNISSVSSTSKSDNSSTCSSNSSNTLSSNDNSINNNETSDDDDDDDDDADDDDFTDDTISQSDEDKFNIIINKFPTNVICLEKMDKTLDYLLEKEEQEEVELAAIMAQIVFILIVYQKCFKFTHNDLHSHNIMYNNTDRKFIFYQFNNKVYKIPTFGKIFKIIDFGRAVYTFKGIKCISDSFSQIGDAATQFNMEPYLNKDKPIIEENFSFDLCRLAVSIYDFIIDDDTTEKEIDNSPICRLINEWISDDKGRNVLYKQNKQERYPDFKLYKMIVRTVNNHIPSQEILKPIFEQFITPKKKINKSSKIFNIDNLPDYTVNF